MAAVESKEIYKTEIRIHVSDINYGGHLGNDRFLTLAQEARVRLFLSKGWSEKNIADSGSGIIVTEAHIKYLKEVFLGQTLEVKIFLGKVRRCSFELQYDLIEKESQELVGSIQTQLAFFDYQRRKISSCPAFFEEIS